LNQKIWGKIKNEELNSERRTPCLCLCWWGKGFEKEGEEETMKGKNKENEERRSGFEIMREKKKFAVSVRKLVYEVWQYESLRKWIDIFPKIVDLSASSLYFSGDLNFKRMSLAPKPWELNLEKKSVPCSFCDV
jgi:hypothetical protein